ncbi:MAG: putative Ig domain-containing protein, partial [bacterium]
MKKGLKILLAAGLSLVAAFFLFTACTGGGGGGIPAIGPAIDPPTAPAAIVGVPYNLSFRWTANTVKPPFFWNVIGSMPPGTQFDPLNGRIYGTPTTPGAFAFTVVVRDSNNPQAQEIRNYSIVVNGPPTIIILTPPANPPLRAKKGIPFYREIHPSGGMPPYICSVSGFLPPGISLNTATCTLSGTPTQTGPYTFTIDVFDSQSPPNTVSRIYTINVIDPIQILTSELPVGKVGEPYPIGAIPPGTPFQLLAKGGVPCTQSPGPGPYIWSFESGYYPPGLNPIPPTGQISGVPTQSGFYDFLVRVTDCDDINPDPTIIQPESITANVRITIVGPLNFVRPPPPLNECKRTYYFSQEFNATGGVPPYTWSLDGQLAPGLTFDNATGHITGIPQITGTYSFGVTVTDSNTPPNVAVNTFIGLDALNCIDPIIITTDTLPNGIVGNPYFAQVQAKGGRPDCESPPGANGYNFTLDSGFFPPGLTLNLDGTIIGVPVATGTFDFLVRVIDCSGESATKNLSITIGNGLVITTEGLPECKKDYYYSAEIQVTGGVPPYLWSLDGQLSPGLTFDITTGHITGIPLTAGAFPFTVTVTDSETPPNTATASYTLICIDPIIITTDTLPTGEVGQPYNGQVQAKGGRPNCPDLQGALGLFYNFAFLNGFFPPGLTLNLDGSITGIPTTPGTYDFFVEVRDCNGEFATKNLSITIVGPPVITTTLLEDAYVGNFYFSELQETGGIAPFVWQVVAPTGDCTNLADGPLPPGLTLSTGGVISGVPTIANTTGYPFCVQITDSLGVQDEQDLVIRVLQDNVLCVDGFNGDDPTGDGTKTRPFKTITRALQYTSTNNTDTSGTLTRIGAILVAGDVFSGIYTYSENIVLDASAAVQTDVNLYGGYFGFCQFRGGTPNSRIKGVASAGLPTIRTEGLTRNTWIERFEIEGDDATVGSSAAIFDNFSGAVPSSPTIARNIIRGGNSSGPFAESYGVLDDGGSPLIIENTIYGGTGARTSIGVFANFGSTAEIRDNTIDGGDPSGGVGVGFPGVTTSAGVKSGNGSSVLVYDNIITGGTGFNAFGVWFDPGFGTVARNIITCEGEQSSPSATEICAGVFVDDGSSATIEANSINENRPETGSINALGNSTRGIFIDTGSAATILGNSVIYGGEASVTAYGIVLDGASTATIGSPIAGGPNSINGGGCNLFATPTTYGIKTFNLSVATVLNKTINGGCGTGLAVGVAADPSTLDADGNNIYGGGIPAVQSPQTSIGVMYDQSDGALTNNMINGGNGMTCIALQVIGNPGPSPITGNTYTCGGDNSYGLWYENCDVGTDITGHD